MSVPDPVFSPSLYADWFVFLAGNLDIPKYEASNAELKLIQMAYIKASSLGLDCFVERTDEEREALEAVDEWLFGLQIKDTSDSWTDLKEKICPKPWRTSVMWKPANEGATYSTVA